MPALSHSMRDPHTMSLEPIPLPDACMHYNPNWIAQTQADELYRELANCLPWEQPVITVFGRSNPIPRLQSWHGDPNASYRYSGHDHAPQPWTSALSSLREHLQTELKTPFNAVLANWYRNGNDTMGWHSDDEPELGPTPTIASISLGAERSFRLRHRHNHQQTHSIELSHGSLLVMSEHTQDHWQHSLPARKRVQTGRINLTFRYVHPSHEH